MPDLDPFTTPDGDVDASPPTLVVERWPDPVIDQLGHDPRSWYVETFWLPTLGPTSLLLLRHCAAVLTDVDSVTLAVADTSRALGLGERTGATSPLLRAVARLCQFDLASPRGRGAVAVRTTIPPVNRRHIRRLPPGVQDRLAGWQAEAAGAPPLHAVRQRARRAAFVLVELGDDVDVVERTLHRLDFHPALCREAAEWATARHREAASAAAAAAATPGTGPAPAVGASPAGTPAAAARPADPRDAAPAVLPGPGSPRRRPAVAPPPRRGPDTRPAA